jgi:outer membrane protein insertion porin family
VQVAVAIGKPVKALIFTLFMAFSVLSTTFAVSAVSAVSAQAAVVSSIEVRGNTRMDNQTVASFVTIKPGQKFDNGDIDDSVKALFATGLFGDVSIYQSGSVLVVEVDENATINEVFFEGNKRLKDEPLAGMVQSKSRGIYSAETVASDVDIISGAYSRVGRSDAIVTSEIVPLANNRVNIVYKVNEGGKTKIKSLTFVGNNSFRSARLREVISTKRSNLMSWLKNDDIYDPDRISADEERLRRFYFNNGFADFQILSTSAVLDEAENQYNITITVEEGNKYRFGDINIESTLTGVDAGSLYSKLESKSGKVYSAKAVEDSIIALSETVAAGGFAFVEVVPRGDRDFNNNTINVTYIIDEGAKVFVDRIVIVGNDRTREYVIRREFDISEGDAFNQVYVQQAKRRLEALGYIESVDVSVRPSDSVDRVTLVVRVVEKASGEFSIGGGYSTAGGALGEISFTESNFMGRGQKIRISGSFGEQENSYRLSFTEPYFLGYRMSAGFDVGRTTSNSNSDVNYSSETTFGTIRFGLPLTQHTDLSTYYVYSATNTTASSSKIDKTGTQGDVKGELSAALAPPLSPSSWTKSGFGYTLTHNTLDDNITPREGLRAEFGQTIYGAGGDATYVKSEAKAQLYATLSEDLDLVGMVRGRAGANTPFGNDNGYRALDNFFQGGTDIRGFRSNGFGPRDPITGDALGGMYYWNATAELNFPIPFLPESSGVRAAVFADAGSLWGVDSESSDAIKAILPSLSSNKGDVNDNAMRASVGASIIWNSPFGPLRFDYAEPVMSQKYDKIRQFSFGVSTAF